MSLGFEVLVNVVAESPVAYQVLYRYKEAAAEIKDQMSIFDSCKVYLHEELNRLPVKVSLVARLCQEL